MIKISRNDLEFLKREYPDIIQEIEKDNLDEVMMMLFEKIVYYTSEVDGLSDEGRKFDEIYFRLYNDNE